METMQVEIGELRSKLNEERTRREDQIKTHHSEISSLNERRENELAIARQ